jgi:preprotein translocase subunit SecA
MTGTAVTEAGRVMANIYWRCRNSTNRGMARKDKEDFIYKTTRENSMP